MRTPSLNASLALAGVLLLSPLVPSSLAYTDRGPSHAGIIVSHLEFDASLREIGDTTYAARKELAKDLDARLKATHDALGDIRTNDLAPEVRAQFRAALDAEGDARSELNSRIRAVRNADVDSFETTRSALTDSYRHYVDAAGRAEALAGNSVPAPAR